MSVRNALAGEMRRLLASLRATAPPLDQDTADRLLAVRLDPADAPPGYAALARLLAAATAPPRPDELAGEQAAVAEFVAMTRSCPPTRLSRRAGMPGRRFSAKAIAVALAAVLTIGGVAAAATGLLPESGRRAADEVPTSTTRDSAADVQRDGAAGRDASGAAGDGRGGAAGGAATGGRQAATGPDASGAARDGLCRAWLAGQGSEGRRQDSPAFRALAKAAGGAAKVPAYCRASTAPPADGGRQRPDAPPATRPSPPGSGDGQGQGQGGPPTTG
jgi:hypothetical protein